MHVLFKAGNTVLFWKYRTNSCDILFMKSFYSICILVIQDEISHPVIFAQYHNAYGNQFPLESLVTWCNCHWSAHSKQCIQTSCQSGFIIFRRERVIKTFCTSCEFKIISIRQRVLRARNKKQYYYEQTCI